VVRRPTGGRAVWHEEELTYAVAAPAALFGDLPLAYRRIHEMLAEAVALLGVAPTLAGRPMVPTGLDAGACFAVPAGGEVLVGGRKVVGSAQVRQGKVLLQHGSLLLGGSQRTVGLVSAGPAPPEGETSLSTALGREVSFEEAASAVAAAAGTPEPLDFERDVPAILDAAAAHELQFGSEEWTWRR
jgi:lipoate-protein ligase A